MSIIGHSNRRVAVFLPALLGGGAERVMVDVANGLADLGAVDLVLGEARGPFVAEVGRRVRVVELGASRTLSAVRPLAKYLRQERPETLLTTLTRANIAAVLARRLAGGETRVIIRQASPLTPVPGESMRSRMLTRGAAPFYRFADVIVGVSEGISGDLRRRLPRGPEVVTVYNPVVSEELLRMAGAEIAHAWPPSGVPVLLGVGSLTPKKDFATLLRAFSVVRRSHDVRLVILGEGPERPRLEALAIECGVAQDVFLPGFVDNPLPAMSEAAVFALSSVREGLPSVLVQAMACGCPVVATACETGPEEVLEQGAYGRLVPPGDFEALAHAIMEALADPPDRNALRARAAAFSRHNSISRYADLVWG